MSYVAFRFTEGDGAHVTISCSKGQVLRPRAQASVFPFALCKPYLQRTEAWGLRGGLGGGCLTILQGRLLLVVVGWVVLVCLLDPLSLSFLFLGCLDDGLLGRGSARFVGGGSWIVGARRWRVASLREGPFRLDLHLEVRLHSSSLLGVARRRARSSRRL
ncbi:hypothetical protein Taro_006499 [Colocasia esculenta]|uniref:Uncharacterized protein n=1 Tax=Colocasia esculenta TaxID=4460 RepID=A0A843TXK3_COLES|nr:hypothetical protein [Colocasia esculenta]